MYCYKCGVKLQNGVYTCPLCGTPVPVENGESERVMNYSDRFPKEHEHGRYIACGTVTALMIAVGLSCLLLCLKLYGKPEWSGFVLLGEAFLWTVAVLPNLFRRPKPFVHIPLSFAAAGGYVLYISVKTGGGWFLSFAFPVTGLLLIITLTAYTLYRYLPGKRLFVTAGLFITLGSGLMLVEFFEHITFGTKMFLWSLYGVSVMGAAGLFLLVLGLIGPLREYMERHVFF